MMDSTTWLKQTDRPIFEDLLWSRPQNQRLAGKLLIVGGHAHAFVAPAVAYKAALEADIGTVRVLLPDSTQKLLGKSFLEAEFAPSTLSGSFSRQALGLLLAGAGWADGVLLAGDFGHNSETAVLLDSFIGKHSGQITLAGDSVDYFSQASSTLLEREKSLIVTEFSQLQKLSKQNRPELALRHNMSLYELIKKLDEWVVVTRAMFMLHHEDQIVLSSHGKSSTTSAADVNIVQLAAFAAVWWLQQPEKPFEALTSAAWDYKNSQRL